MQFGGQRTNMDFEPLGEPHDILISMSDDTLPSPDAIMVTGITPQKTRQEGLSEAEFLKIFDREIAIPGTIFVGFNTVRFDDEFMRFLLYRNFYDAYEWQWKDGSSRWDLLDVVRMTRALRPEGIKWPVDSEGKATNRLELLTGINGLDHSNAHDALSDVNASISLARLVQQKQPKLFDYLLKMRDKKLVGELVESRSPFLYSSGKYAGEFEKTSAAVFLAPHPKKQGSLVYDLRYDPSPFLSLSPAELAQKWTFNKETRKIELPVKVLQYNRCPAVAPLGTLDASSQKRLQLTIAQITKHHKILTESSDFIKNLLSALQILEKKQQVAFLNDEKTADEQLYDGFFGDEDRREIQKVRSATAPSELTSENFKFIDNRLATLLKLYKCRNFPQSLNDEEHMWWEKYRKNRLIGKERRAQRYFERISELAANTHLSNQQQFVLEELKLYGESIMPEQE